QGPGSCSIARRTPRSSWWRGLGPILLTRLPCSLTISNLLAFLFIEFLVGRLACFICLLSNFRVSCCGCFSHQKKGFIDFHQGFEIVFGSLYVYHREEASA